jgi:hypothetical protein
MTRKSAPDERFTPDDAEGPFRPPPVPERRTRLAVCAAKPAAAGFAGVKQ